VAALWALHPMQVASVAWIAERKNVLYVLLWLGSLLLFVRAEQRRGARVLSLVLFALALLSKAAAMTLPAALVVVRWARGEPLDRRF
jgi:protein O-mannosyl-transferase